MRDKKYLRTIASLIGIFLSCLLFKPVLDFFHTLLNVFASGRSPIRVYVFIVYLLILLVTTATTKKTTKPAPVFLTIFTLLTTFSLGVYMHFWFYNQYELPANQYIVSIVGSELSSTRLVHNHLGKVVVGEILTFLHVDYLENADPGTPYSTLLPSNLTLSFSFLFLLGTILCLLTFKRLMANRTQYKIPFILFYGLLSFALLKNIIDGGVFSEVSLLALIFFVLLITKEKNWNKNIFILIGTLFFLVSKYALYYFGYYADQNELLSVLWKSFTFFTVCMFAYYALDKKTNSRILLLLLCFPLITVGKQVYDSTMQKNAYRHISLDPKETYVGTYESLPSENKLFSIRNLSYYKLQEPKEKTIGDYLSAHNLFESFYPVTVGFKTCIPGTPKNTLKASLLSQEKLNEQVISNRYIQTTLELEKKTNFGYLYTIRLATHPCLSRTINILEESVRHSGGKTFFLYNPIINNEPIPF